MQQDLLGQVRISSFRCMAGIKHTSAFLPWTKKHQLFRRGRMKRGAGEETKIGLFALRANPRSPWFFPSQLLQDRSARDSLAGA